MRLSSAIVALPLLLGGCALPGNIVSGAIASETTLSGKGSLGVAGTKPAPNPLAGDGRLVGAGGNVIAAGGGNVIAAGGGNVIAAGGGNAIAPNAAPVIAAGGGNVIAAGGGNLIITSGSGVIAAGGMNLTGGTKSLEPTGTLPESLPGGPGDLPNMAPVGSLEAGTVAGKVVVPGAMVGRTDATVAVPHTYVGVYDLAGQQIAPPVATDDSGAFRLEGVPAFRMLSLRTIFTYNGHSYYVSSLVRVEATDVSVDLSPVSTVTEAEFFKKANGVAPQDTLIGSPYLTAFLAGLGAWNGEVAADALAADAPLATRAASYAALKKRHPDAFKNDVDAAFDHTATVDPTGLLSGEVPAGELAVEL